MKNDGTLKSTQFFQFLGLQYLAAFLLRISNVKKHYPSYSAKWNSVWQRNQLCH